MTSQIMKYVNAIRFTLYTLALVVVGAAALASLTSCSGNPPKKLPMSEANIAFTIDAEDMSSFLEVFWPPDMVPHPMPPEDRRKDDNMA